MSRKTRKLMWSVPLIAAVAVIGALAAFMTLTPNGASAHDLPGPVQELTAEGISWSSIKLSWKAPATGGAVTGYRIDVSTDEFIWAPLVMNTGNTRTTYTHTGLKGGVTRNYRVFALNAAGAGPSPVGEDASNDLYTAGESLPAEAPGQVKNLSAEAVDHEQIDVKWYDPASTGGADITRYCLIVGIDREHLSSFSTTAFDNGCTGTADATEAGEATSTEGDEINGITNLLTDDTAPTVGYLIVIDAKRPAGHEGHWPMFAHKGLNADQTLYYRLYAANSVDPSATATNIAKATTDKAPKPGAPRNLKIVSQDNSVNLYWNWPANALDTPVTGFYWETRSSIADDWTDPVQVGATTFPVQMTNTPAPTLLRDDDDNASWLEYRVRVGMGGTPSKAARIKLVAPADPTNDPPTLPAEEGLPGVEDPTNTGTDLDLTAESTLRTVTLQWERKGEPGDSAADPVVPAETLPSGFVIDAVMGAFDDSPTGFQPLQQNTGYTGKLRGTETTSQYIHKGAQPDQTWYYRVFPYSSGSKNYGNPLLLEASTKPAEPPAQYTCEQVSAADDGPTKIMVSWPAPSEDGGSPVIGFLVQVASDTDDNGSLSSSATWQEVELGLLDADARSYTYDPEDALEAGSVRWFRVIVLNAVNTADGDIIRSVDGTINETDPNVDLAPVCSRVMGETAEAGTPGQPDGLVAEPARDAGSLDPDNPVPDSERGVLLLWNKPDNPAGDSVTGYVIARRVRENSTADWGDWDNDWAEIDETATSYTDPDEVSGLDDGEARQYRVSAQSGAGAGMYVEITYPHGEAMHMAAEPTRPQGVSASLLQNGISVTWTAVSATEAMQVKVALFDVDANGSPQSLAEGYDMNLHTINPATGDPGAHTFTNVPSGTYRVGVASYADGMHRTSLSETITVP